MVEKILNVSGKEVKLKSTASTLRNYRTYFGRDMIKDLALLQKKLSKVQNKDEEFEIMDLEMYENIAWAMAKTADPNVKPIDEWLNDFDTFAITEILPTIIELLQGNFNQQNEEKK